MRHDLVWMLEIPLQLGVAQLQLKILPTDAIGVRVVVVEVAIGLSIAAGDFGNGRRPLGLRCCGISSRLGRPWLRQCLIDQSATNLSNPVLKRARENNPKTP